MRSRGHVPVGRLRLIEGEYLIEYRLNAACRYGAAHRLKHLHRADGDGLHIGATGKDSGGVGRRLTALDLSRQARGAGDQ